MSTDPLRDDHGTLKLVPDAPSGEAWHSTWHMGGARGWSHRARDPLDLTGFFELRGRDPAIAIDGGGIAWLAGASPRMYVNDPSGAKTWGNVEITFYASRSEERIVDAAQGFVAAARSEHQSVTATAPCFGTGYYGRVLYSGLVNFQKELAHFEDDVELGYSPPRPSNCRISWNSDNGEIPRDTWVGYKFIVRNDVTNSAVNLSLYLDLTDGRDGGHWEEIITLRDDGGWAVQDVRTCRCAKDQILLQPASSIFIRNTEISKVGYKKFSVREVASLSPALERD